MSETPTPDKVPGIERAEPALEPEPMDAIPLAEARAILRRMELSLYSGPLPSPQQLREYDDLLPGAAERLFLRFEKQSDHRITMEDLVVRADIRRADRGLIAGWSIAIGGLGVACALGLTGHEIAASVVGALDLVALAGVFIYGTASRRREREEKADMLSGQGEQADGG